MSKYIILKRSMQLIFSVSIFGLFVFYSCGFCYVYPLDQSILNDYFSTTWLLSMLERKYMFLICNILIVFLAKTSSTSSLDHSEYSQYSKPSISAKDHHELVVDIDQEEHDEELVVNVMKKKEEFYGRSSENEFAPIEEEKEVEDDDIDEIFTDLEELNRKFDEFIRKMKEEIRIQPQTLHPIAV
ncbi:unnamed protein product [Trifolium pratense]|uniref:Uncharacterized protein n=1 Tax=Trifolium pratense TaxID=57577 RepID=A0ACB0JYZ5_TRIPR|nr:unnamed protein product [Trifolium pratense]